MQIEFSEPTKQSALRRLSEGTWWPVRTIAILCGLIALAIVKDVQAQYDNLIPNVCYSYEEESVQTGGNAFHESKTDYSWGRLQKRGSVLNEIRHSVYRSNPDDNLYYTFSVTEMHTTDLRRVYYFQRDVESRLDRQPRSVAEAKESFEQRFNTPQRILSFQDSGLSRMQGANLLLGMCHGRPVWEIATDTIDSPTNIVFRVFNNDERSEMVFDKAQMIFTRFVSEPAHGVEQKVSSFRNDVEVNPVDSGFLMTMKSSATLETGPYSLLVTTQIQNYDIKCTQPIALTFKPEEGEQIHSTVDPQIRYEWRDGKVAKVINPFADPKAADVAFQKQSKWWLLLFNILIIAIFVAALVWRRGRLLVLFFVFSWASESAASDVYCGVYSLHAAAKALGTADALDRLVSPEFVTSTKGSTAADLVRAAKSVGLEGVALRGLGIASLRAANYPLILHAAPLGAHGNFQHWILFLGFDEHHLARVLDGPGGVVTCPVEEVLARWDGIAVSIRRPESPPTRYLSTEAGEGCLLIVYAWFFTLVLAGLKSKAAGRQRTNLV